MTSSRRSSSNGVQVTTICQPTSGLLVDKIKEALADSRYTSMRAAVAYATTSGVQELSEMIDQTSKNLKWLTAVDWFRSEPAALGSLNGSSRSEVKIHRGKEALSRQGCTPKTIYHPKAFLFAGPDLSLLISGSGNLSANGLRRGVEFGTTIAVEKRGRGGKCDASPALDTATKWFDTLWRAADRYADIADEYSTKYAERPTTGAPIDFGDPPSTGKGKFKAQELAQISRAEVMWIEAGNMTPRTQTGPSFQLMMRPYTRVFFGIASAKVPTKTGLGNVLISLEGTNPIPRPIEYAHNSMDRLNLPTSDGQRPATYDGRTLVFKKRAGSSAVVFDLTIATGSDIKRLRRASEKNGMHFKMSGAGREFGFV